MRDHTAMEQLQAIYCIVYGGLGAFFSYLVFFYSDRLKGREELPKMKMIKIAVDVFVIIFIGIVWTVFIIEPVSAKQAVLSGATAEAAALKLLGSKP